MKVYVVNECECWSECGDLVCVATSIPKAIQYLVKHRWLTGDTDIELLGDGTLRGEFGDEWQSKLEQMDTNQLNDLLFDLLFHEMEVIE